MRQPVRSEEDYCWGGRNAQFQSEAQRLWLERMGERGWTVPTWPREYGGGGLDAGQALVLAQEMSRLGCRPALYSFGIWMLGPALLKFGNEAQKARAPAEDRARRDPLVPGLFRTQCRLGPGLAGHAR
jgi:acyl-CoA dehydrogenase